MSNNYPKLHNAMWPGIVGKGTPDSEPIIPLDRLLELTANAEFEGHKFDGIDPFVVAPHFDIDSDKDAVKRMTDHIASYGLKVGSFVTPIWTVAGGGSAVWSVAGVFEGIGAANGIASLAWNSPSGLRSRMVISPVAPSDSIPEIERVLPSAYSLAPAIPSYRDVARESRSKRRLTLASKSAGSTAVPSEYFNPAWSWSV